jgi:hypothetical protein
MKSPKEKAEQLIEQFRPLVVHDKDGEDGFEYSREVETYYAKQCAFIAVDEIINSVDDEHVSDIFNDYWEEVKQELEKTK